MKVIINPDKCKLSGECIKVCPQNAISVKDNKAVIDYKKCDSDGICIHACPESAIELVESD
jgi:ferredoxin